MCIRTISSGNSFNASPMSSWRRKTSFIPDNHAMEETNKKNCIPFSILDISNMENAFSSSPPDITENLLCFEKTSIMYVRQKTGGRGIFKYCFESWNRWKLLQHSSQPMLLPRSRITEFPISKSGVSLPFQSSGTSMQGHANSPNTVGYRDFALKIVQHSNTLVFGY